MSDWQHVFRPLQVAIQQRGGRGQVPSAQHLCWNALLDGTRGKGLGFRETGLNSQSWAALLAICSEFHMHCACHSQPGHPGIRQHSPEALRHFQALLCAFVAGDGASGGGLRPSRRHLVLRHHPAGGAHCQSLNCVGATHKHRAHSIALLTSINGRNRSTFLCICPKSEPVVLPLRSAGGNR